MSEKGSCPISIDERLAGLAKTSSNQFIFRIDPVLRRANEEAYEPEKLSIGPYHHGKNKLQDMEKYKLKYLKRLLTRRGESSAQGYIDALMEDEEKARNYYTEDIRLSREAFVEMLLLDGCFIIELLRKWDNPQVHYQKNDDPIFLLLSESWCKDLLLFENQIPFFVLVKLFDMTKIHGQQEKEPEKDLIHLAISRLYPLLAADQPPESSYNVGGQEEIIHLLSLLYKSWCSSMDTLQSSSSGPETSDFSVVNFCPQFICVHGKEEKDLLAVEGVKSVSELEGDGIEFKKANQSRSCLDIKFKNGVMEIPPLMVEDNTESLLRNLITYEQYMFDKGYSSWNFVTSYAIFMDCLINSPEDVKTLRQRRIIKCWLSNDEEIANMFNKICNNVMFLSPCFSYKKVFKDVNEYCSKRRNTWRAHLKKNYFSNPWSIISFLAATLLLLLTIAQTVFSALQTVKKPST